MRIYGVDLIDDGDMVLHHQARTRKPFELESVSAWQDACSEGGTVLDIGAYTGLYSLIADELNCTVHAFEPNPVVFNRLLANCEKNGADVLCHNLAVSDHSGEVGFCGRPGVKLTSAGQVRPGSGTYTVTVDGLGLTDVAAIKIDVEGHEPEVLKGATETLKRCKPLLITEALDDEAFLQQAALLRPLGYGASPADERNLLWSVK